MERLRRYCENGFVAFLAVIVMGTGFMLAETAWGLVSGAKPTVWAGGGAAVLNTTVNGFVPILGTATPTVAASEATVAVPIPMPAHVHDLKCQLVTIAGVLTAAGGTSVQLVVRDNEATVSAASNGDSPTCTIATAATGCVDTTHDLLTAKGDQLDIQVIPTGTPTATVVQCGVEVDL